MRGHIKSYAHAVRAFHIARFFVLSRGLSRGAAVGFVVVAVVVAWAERDTRTQAVSLAVRNCRQIEAVKARIVVSVKAGDTRIDSYKGLSAAQRADAHALNRATVRRFAPLPCP